MDLVEGRAWCVVDEIARTRRQSWADAEAQRIVHDGRWSDAPCVGCGYRGKQDGNGGNCSLHGSLLWSEALGVGWGAGRRLRENGRRAIAVASRSHEDVAIAAFGVSPQFQRCGDMLTAPAYAL
jgi:hypothetical protein